VTRTLTTTTLDVLWWPGLAVTRWSRSK